MHTPFRSFSSLALAALLSAAAFVGGCSAPEGRDADAEPTATSELSRLDMALARASVSVIAGSEAHCNMCHSATREDIRRWGEAMQAVEAECFAQRGASAEERIECLKDLPNDPDSTFSPARLGLYSAAVTHKALRVLFEPGYVPQEDIESEWEEESQDERYLNFKNQAAMPMRGRPLTEDEFSMVKRWVLGGMQGLDEAMDEVEADENAS